MQNELRITNIRPVIGFVDRNPKFSQENIHIIILDFRLEFGIFKLEFIYNYQIATFSN